MLSFQQITAIYLNARPEHRSWLISFLSACHQQGTSEAEAMQLFLGLVFKGEFETTSTGSAGARPAALPLGRTPPIDVYLEELVSLENIISYYAATH